MKKLLLFAAVIACISFTTMQQKKKILFFGDSITQAGVGPKGYITKFGEKIAAAGKKDQYEIMGAGIGGNKVYDLYLRMDDDVLAKNPDIVVIWVGVNDVWHKRSFGTGTDPDRFDRFYTAIIKKLQAKNIQVYLCTPAAIGERTDFSNELDGDLNQYSKLVRTIAQKNNCTVIDLREAFLKYNVANNKENKESGILTTDRVHLNDKGNDFVADEMLKVIKL